VAANPKDPPKHLYTLDEYFALEHVGDARYEYWNGEIVCMSGGSLAHSRISTNVIVRLSQSLGGTRCQVFNGDLAVKTPTLLPYRYPDISVVCGDPKVESMRGIDALLNPALIVEVLSPSTSQRDHEDKFVAYQSIEAFGEYVLIAQDAPLVTHYLRQGGQWSRQVLTELDSMLDLKTIDCSLSLNAIHKDVVFSSL
jgi:Uma2 family endonuclease